MEGVVLTPTGFWRDRHVLITGCTGLLGGWLTRRLVDRQASVVGLVRDWAPDSELVRSRLIDRIHVVRGEVQDQALLERCLGEYEVSTVFHLAAQTIVPIANANPIGTFDSNIRGTWSVLEACRRSPTVRQVLVASSDKAYGNQPKLPYSEDMPLLGRHPYDASKACADIIAQAYAATYGLPACVTRCGNLFGGGDLNWNRLVPGTIRSALRGERPLVRSDGKMVRDYLYVEDAVDAYLLTAECLAQRPELAGEVFNISYEAPLTVLDLVQRVLVATGRTQLEPDIRDEARNEIPRQHLDASKAKKSLGWKPRLTLDEGLARSVEWYREFLSQPVPTGAPSAV